MVDEDEDFPGTDVEETPSLEDVILTGIERALIDVRVAMPARILSYDPATQTALVQPEIKIRFADDTVEDRPPIPGVPVIHLRGGGAFIHLPVKKDDKCQLLFNDRSIDRWLKDGTSVDPLDPRKHHINDAVAIVGLSSRINRIPNADPDDVVIGLENGKAEVHIDPNGAVWIKAESVDLGSQEATDYVALAALVKSELAALWSAHNALVLKYNLHMHPTAAPGAPSPPTLPETAPPGSAGDVKAEKVRAD